METDAWVRFFYGLEWSGSSMWLAGGFGMVWFFLSFSGALERIFFLLDNFLEFLCYCWLWISLETISEWILFT